MWARWSGWKFCQRHIYCCSLVAKRYMGWYAMGPWAPSPQMFESLSNLSTPFKRTNQDKWRLDVCKVGGHLNETFVRNLFNSWAFSKLQLAFRRCWATSLRADVSYWYFLCALLHNKYKRYQPFYQVAFRELVICFVSNQIELASLQSNLLYTVEGA